MTKRRKVKKLLLLLSLFSNKQKNALASTIGWMAEEKGILFDAYYDSYRLGDHFGGGPLDRAEAGRPFGSTLTGFPHTDVWHSILASYECSVVLLEDSCFLPWVESYSIPVVASGVDAVDLAIKTAEFLGISPPQKLIVTGGSGEDAYLYPLIAAERAIAAHVSGLEKNTIEGAGIKDVHLHLCSGEEIDMVKSKGIRISESHDEHPPRDMLELSRSLAGTYNTWCKGYFLGDPIVTAHYLPWLQRERRLALYSEPLEPIITGEILSKLDSHPVVYGRMFVDEDAMTVSKLGGCWQLVDPGRPPFPASYPRSGRLEAPEGLFEHLESRYDESTLGKHAENGDILTSLVFWSGCIREIENFSRLFELIAVSRFKCGVAVTTETFALGANGPFAPVALPLERGGVFPLVEPILSSSGMGFSLESYLPDGTFERHMDESTARLASTVHETLRPRGWWACLDTTLKLTASPERRVQNRPFGRYLPGEAVTEIHASLARHGIRYAISKSSELKSLDQDGKELVIMPQNAGRWQGWSPFFDVENIEDIKRAEKTVFTGGRPGYILGTIDSCLWTFSYPHWQKGHELKEMVDFILQGGRTGRIVPVHPYTVYRYAKFLRENGYGCDPEPPAGTGATISWYAMRFAQALKKISSHQAQA